MKKTKVIIPALGLLVLSTAASVTGTVAWFAANASVSATGMQISVNSNTTYLLVSHANTGDEAPANAAAIQGENSGEGFLSIAFSAEAKEVYPVAPASAFSAATYYQAGDSEVEAGTKNVGDVKSAATHTDYAAGTGISDPTYWYTMAGTSATAAGYVGVTGSEVDVTSDAFTNYVLKYSLYFTIAAGANPATNLVVDSINITTGANAAAIRCLTVGAAGSALFTASTDTDSIPLVASLNSSTVSRVNVYCWYDGNDSTIYTNNMSNILDGTISLTFKVTAGAAA